SSLFSALIAILPAQATAPALILLGIMMLPSFKDINWTDLEDAIPAFFASIFMALCYSISYGIAVVFIFYAVVKVVKVKAKEVSPSI
ncbi:NCS2 family permease, partial [Enterococcus faecalis]